MIKERRKEKGGKGEKGGGGQVRKQENMCLTAWRDIGRNRKMTCMQGTEQDEREAEDRCAHLSASPGGGGGPTASGGSRHRSAGTPPSHPIALPHFSLSSPC